MDLRALRVVATTVKNSVVIDLIISIPTLHGIAISLRRGSTFSVSLYKDFFAMLTINELPGYARVWIYQADRLLTETEQQFITEASAQFVAQWAAHGTPLTAAAQVLKGYFLVLGVDEAQAQASGCSIDKSVHFVKSIGAQLNIDFFNRLNLAVETPAIQLVPLSEFENLAANGTISPDTYVYDNTVTTAADFAARWHTKASNTWLSRYFAKQTA